MNALPDLVNFVENVADLRFPPKADARIQVLMDRNTEGGLSPAEREVQRRVKSENAFF